MNITANRAVGYRNVSSSERRDNTPLQSVTLQNGKTSGESIGNPVFARAFDEFVLDNRTKSSGLNLYRNIQKARQRAEDTEDRYGVAYESYLEIQIAMSNLVAREKQNQKDLAESVSERDCLKAALAESRYDRVTIDRDACGYKAGEGVPRKWAEESLKRASDRIDNIVNPGDRGYVWGWLSDDRIIKHVNEFSAAIGTELSKKHSGMFTSFFDKELSIDPSPRTFENFNEMSNKRIKQLVGISEELTKAFNDFRYEWLDEHPDYEVPLGVNFALRHAADWLEVAGDRDRASGIADMLK